jgi:surface carbohydrate biosynthesis protein
MPFKFIFKLPLKKDVVLIYPNQESLIKDYILKEISYECIDVGNWLCLHPQIILNTFKLFSSIKISKCLSAKGRLITLIKRMYEKHLQAYIEAIGPRVVITFIDDSTVFHRLACNYNFPTYISIQNGLRQNFYFDLLRSLNTQNIEVTKYAQNFFCFGYQDISNFEQHGLKVDNYHPMGSLVGGIFFENLQKPKVATYDLCYLPCWTSKDLSHAQNDKHRIFLQADIDGSMMLEKNLKRLMQEKSYTLIVALKNEGSKVEKSYYLDIFGDDVTFKDASRANFSSYQAMSDSRITISLNSTITAEAIGMGYRGLFVNGSCYEGFRMDEAGIAYYEGSDYHGFANRVSDILNMSTETYSASMINVKKNIMNFNSHNLPHTEIRKTIKNLLTST